MTLFVGDKKFARLSNAPFWGSTTLIISDHFGGGWKIWKSKTGDSIVSPTKERYGRRTPETWKDVARVSPSLGRSSWAEAVENSWSGWSWWLVVTGAAIPSADLMMTYSI